ncbi:SMC family ATPase [Aneurinibacillus thermoaerophilus]|uniref:Nuclease SbcCD subunit C n=1 Tax=Aneurinibacillus thermoaerophilus TaxID=143495 RepID=A0A1G7YUV8_ANETH|nr:SMC family ATPase [Aneurinibacillus thermoaerophilus]MED0758707.1 SMC family ATPase [Aneurinibacillus thermoaerophilus]MED0760982.1 SMC family ATPase [Aneurinibacillus thermoaerophilus]SDH00224.1 exonuclease SbcC [Aneurinibacillus thermoaerophilus]
MRPIKVTMTAFGPYKHKETIDFTELGEHRLFVISGNTGAGKTTIFDAICFALYGEASGEERNDAKFLRSHFAADDVHTSVELIFELRGRTYRVFRQLGHVKAGNKTATGAQIELYEVTGDGEVPCVDRFTVNDVNQKIESLLGLTKHQFSQIVMLPQGEFRKLLTSETENKEEILRRIFKTEPYQAVEDALNRRRKEADRRVVEAWKEQEKFISQISAFLPEREGALLFVALEQETRNIHQIMTGLAEEYAYHDTQAMIHKARLAQVEEAYRTKNETYHRARNINERFAELDRKRAAAEELENKTEVMERMEARLLCAERAGRIEAHEEHWMSAQREEAEKERELARAREAEAWAKERLAQVKRTYEQEEAREPERQTVAREVERMREMLSVVEALSQKEGKLRERKQKLVQLEESLVEAVRRQEAAKEQKAALLAEIKELEGKVVALARKRERLAEMRLQFRAVDKYMECERSLSALKREVEAKRAACTAAGQEYEALERRWIEGQASLLALHLRDGEPCPVCGSAEHPKKAGSYGHIPTKEQLQEAKKARDETEKALRAAEARLNAGQESLKGYAEEMASYGFDPYEVRDVHAGLVREGQKLRAEVETLERDEMKLAERRQEYERLEAQWERQAEQNSRLERELQEMRIAYERERAAYETQLVSVPEPLRSLDILRKHYQEAVQRKEEAEVKWKRTQEQYRHASEQALKASSNVQHAQKLLAEAAVRNTQAEQRFAEARFEAGFMTVEAYREAKLPAPERERMKKELERFAAEKTAVMAQLKELERELAGKERFDTQALLRELECLKAECNEARDAHRAALNCRDKAHELAEHIAKANERVKAVEEERACIADLYDVVRGENRYKISFERYLQIEFLEKIIQMANERLYNLSNGQFQLRRSDRLEKRGRQSGLGLDVYDGYTGYTRDVKTLSGGEKFNASLCLALGMADVIQAYQGGISIETMFIDEGFGSLDDESLHKAIDTLIELQSSGRMIGVISHVQELKSAIPATLEVQKTKEGYSRTKFVLRE